jgi:hypothetical protein
MSLEGFGAAPLPPSPSNAQSSSLSVPELNATTNLKSYNVFIGLSPMKNPGWLTYLPQTSNVPYLPGWSAMLLIFWETETTMYEILLNTYAEHPSKVCIDVFFMLDHITYV